MSPCLVPLVRNTGDDLPYGKSASWCAPSYSLPRTAQQIYVRDIQFSQPAPNCCMVDGVECVLEINIYHIESRPTLGSRLNDPVERLHLPLCAAQASEAFLGGIRAIPAVGKGTSA